MQLARWRIEWITLSFFTRAPSSSFGRPFKLYHSTRIIFRSHESNDTKASFFFLPFLAFLYIPLLLKANDQLFSSCHAFDKEYAIVHLELILASFMRCSMNSLANERHRATSIRMSMNPVSRRCAQKNFNFSSYK